MAAESEESAMGEEAKKVQFSETPRKENPKDSINNVHGRDSAAREEAGEAEQDDTAQEKGVIPVAAGEKNNVSSAPSNLSPSLSWSTDYNSVIRWCNVVLWLGFRSWWQR